MFQFDALSVHVFSGILIGVGSFFRRAPAQIYPRDSLAKKSASVINIKNIIYVVDHVKNEGIWRGGFQGLGGVQRGEVTCGDMVLNTHLHFGVYFKKKAGVVIQQNTQKATNDACELRSFGQFHLLRYRLSLSQRGLSPLQFIYFYLQYAVHPSYKSQTAIRITRRLAPQPFAQSVPVPPENPYVFKPKSYSRKRNIRETLLPSHLIPPTPKKFKQNCHDPQNAPQQNYLDKRYIIQQLNDSDPSYFGGRFRETETQSAEFKFQLPLKHVTSLNMKKNPLLSHHIEIVSTGNEKLSIQIHQGLLKANTNHSKQERTLDGVVNPYNARLEKEFSNKIEFIKDYKSGYTPIELQNKSKKEDEKEKGEQSKKDKLTESASKTHFIKKKQSTLSLTRTCGVSYIKPSESIQKPPFETLPPLIFQCSTSCNYTNDFRAKFHPQIQKLISLGDSVWLPAILSSEEHMRDILLGNPYGKVIWVQGLKNLWPLFNEGTFILVFFDKILAETEEELWKQFNTSIFKFGILAKRSTSGKKLFLKSIQAENFDKCQITSLRSFDTLELKTNKSALSANEELRNESQAPLHAVQDIEKSSERMVEEKKMEESPLQEKKQCRDVYEELAAELMNSRTVITMSLKFEMYVHEASWKNLDSEGKNLLNAIILTLEEHLQKSSIEIIRDRFELSKKSQREDILSKALQKIKIGNSISDLLPAQKFYHQAGSSFSLQTLTEFNDCLELRDSSFEERPVLPISYIFRDREGKENFSLWQKSLKMPIYYISTRDSFAFDLVEKITDLQRQGRTYQRIEYFFEPENAPDNFAEYRKLFPQLNTGVVSYHGFFTEEELQFFENQTLKTQLSAFKNKFLQMTVQPTITGNRIKRTKFFFGYRYMWTRCQLAEPLSYVGAGVRRDVTEPPKWIRSIENPMVEHGILEKNFLNSFAINVYHDGTEGLAQHFDDAVRFRQPIYTLRLVSDGRLSFGSQFYGFCNGAFIIPLPRGCICVMNENSYAANGVKHCVRPCDMSGKSAAIIMRQMHHQVVKEASKYDELIDFPAWLSTLSEDPRAITYAEQKRRWAEQILNQEDKKKERQSKPTIPND